MVALICVLLVFTLSWLLFPGGHHTAAKLAIALVLFALTAGPASVCDRPLFPRARAAAVVPLRVVTAPFRLLADRRPVAAVVIRVTAAGRFSGCTR